MRKSILIFGHNYGTQFIDICNQYSRLFDPTEFKVTVVYLSGEPDQAAKKRTLAEEVIFLNCAKKAIRGLKISPIKKMLALCRERKFSIVICHRYKPSYIMLWVAQFCFIPKIYFVMHALKTMDFTSRKLLIAALARKNMIFAGVSNAVRDDLRNNLWRIPPERIITLYNCIDIELTKPKILTRIAARAELNISANTFVFGTIGRLAPEKDQQTLIRAFAKIKPHCANAKLVIIGSGPLENELKQLVSQLNLNAEVIFTGFLSHAFRFSSAFDVFILSSTKEAFGRVLLEAMLAKVPVIGTRTHGIPEVISDAGIIVEPAQPDKLAGAMLDTYQRTPAQLSIWQEKVYAHVEKNFSLQTFRKIFWGDSSSSL